MEAPEGGRHRRDRGAYNPRRVCPGREAGPSSEARPRSDASRPSARVLRDAHRSLRLRLCRSRGRDPAGLALRKRAFQGHVRGRGDPGRARARRLLGFVAAGRASIHRRARQAAGEHRHDLREHGPAPRRLAFCRTDKGHVSPRSAARSVFPPRTTDSEDLQLFVCRRSQPPNQGSWCRDRRRDRCSCRNGGFHDFHDLPIPRQRAVCERRDRWRAH